MISHWILRLQVDATCCLSNQSVVFHCPAALKNSSGTVGICQSFRPALNLKQKGDRNSPLVFECQAVELESEPLAFAVHGHWWAVSSCVNSWLGWLGEAWAVTWQLCKHQSSVVREMWQRSYLSSIHGCFVLIVCHCEASTAGDLSALTNLHLSQSTLPGEGSYHEYPLAVVLASQGHIFTPLRVGGPPTPQAFLANSNIYTKNQAKTLFFSVFLQCVPSKTP